MMLLKTCANRRKLNVHSTIPRFTKSLDNDQINVYNVRQRTSILNVDLEL